MMKLDEQQQAALARVQLPEDWKMALAPALLDPKMDELRAFLQSAYQDGKQIYPPKTVF